MNLGLRDAVALGEALGQVVGGGSEELLDRYAATSRAEAEQVVEFAHRLTRLATIPARLRPARNVVLRLLAAAPGFRRMLAHRLSAIRR